MKSLPEIRRANRRAASFRARGLRRTAGEMNRTEAAYAEHLNALKAAGDVLRWKFERINIRLAPKTYYRPDFHVQTGEGFIEYHEVKGGVWQDDALVKIKIAAEMFPEYRFIGVTRRLKKDGGGWKVREFSKPETEEP